MVTGLDDIMSEDGFSPFFGCIKGVMVHCLVYIRGMVVKLGQITEYHWPTT